MFLFFMLVNFSVLLKPCDSVQCSRLVIFIKQVICRMFIPASHSSLLGLLSAKFTARVAWTGYFKNLFKSLLTFVACKIDKIKLPL